MAFSFKRKESVSKGIRRLGRMRIEAALECLQNFRQAEAIHCVRKEIKKARAVLRLARSRIGRKDYHRLNTALRDAAEHLSAVRDAHVKSEALKDLIQRLKGQRTRRALHHVRAALQTDLRQEAKRFAKGNDSKIVGRLLRRAARDFDQLAVGGKGWQALCPGLKAAYIRGRRAHRTVLKDSSPENLHEWRKGVKDLWYHVRLLRPVWPEAMDASAHELEMLGEQLGDHHDLFLLRQAAEKRRRQDGDLEEFKTLCGLIEQRQRELRVAALKLGARLYAEKPSAFSDRLSRYWRLWRRKRRHVRAETRVGNPA
jgi:CHAD domain-containing protein